MKWKHSLRRQQQAFWREGDKGEVAKKDSGTTKKTWAIRTREDRVMRRSGVGATSAVDPAITTKPRMTGSRLTPSTTLYARGHTHGLGDGRKESIWFILKIHVIS